MNTTGHVSAMPAGLPIPLHHSVSPFRPSKASITTHGQVATGGEVLPPWKQGEFTAEASYTSMTSSTITQLDQEQHWEQQVTGVKEVGGRGGGVGAAAFYSVMSFLCLNVIVSCHPQRTFRNPLCGLLLTADLANTDLWCLALCHGALWEM